MKKILSTIISVSMIAASAAVPVMADYTAPEESYDITEVNNTYDEGTATNSIDGSNALQIGESFEKIFATGIDTTKEFYLGFDFCFDSESGEIQIPKFKSNGTDVDKVGPIFTTDGTVFRTQNGTTGSGDNKIPTYQELGAFEIGAWYHGEIEGRTGLGQQYTTFRLYKDGELVQETAGFNMRNLSSDSRSFNGMRAKDISIDNVKLIQEKPNMITVSASDEMNAGTDTIFDYVMTRQDIEVNKYTVTWSVYDASDSEPLNDENISISQSGVLSATALAETQTVTVRATAVFGEKELYGSKQITINAIDTSGEKFDTIIINGADSVKAGTKETYTFTATKNGTDVTDSIEENDVIWQIYDYANLKPIYANGSQQLKATLEGGVLTVSDNVLPQTFVLRASSASGTVYGSKTITTSFADSQKETVVFYESYERELGNDRAESVDGSIAYIAPSSQKAWDTANQPGFTVTEMDIKFTGNGAGLTLLRRDGQKINTAIYYNDGNIRTNSGVLMSGADTDTWYHIELLYSTSYAACNIYKYDENGNLGDPATYLDIDRRQASDFGRIDIGSGSCVDNIIIYQPAANSISLTSPNKNMFAGEKMQLTPTLTKDGLPLSGTDGITWTVLDEESLPIIDNSVTIDSTGLLTVDSMAPAQTITVVASTATGASASVTINIQVAEIFTVTNIGINEAGDKIVKLYVDKNFYYNDDVVFAVAVKDADKVLKAVKTIPTFGDRFAVGSNELTTDIDVPAGFDAGTWSVEVMAWTNTEKIGGGSVVSDAFIPAYDAETGIVTLNGLEPSGDQQTLLVLTDDGSSKDENIAQIDQDALIDSFALPKGIENATYYIRIGGSDGTIKLATLTIGNGSPSTPDQPTAEEIIVNSFKAGDAEGAYTATITNNETKAVEIELIVAAYNDNDSLKSVEFEKRAIAPGATETLTVTNTATNKLAAFIWKTENNMPLAESIKK